MLMVAVGKCWIYSVVLEESRARERAQVMGMVASV
jgi:hypothetical protein